MEQEFGNQNHEILDDYEKIAKTVINIIRCSGELPNPDDLNGMALAGDGGRKCAEMIIQEIERYPFLAERYAEMIDYMYEYEMAWC